MATKKKPTQNGLAIAEDARSLAERLDTSLMDAADRRDLVPLETGFDPLDQVLAGGLRAGDLVLVGGVPGVGKTILGLQLARNLARRGQRSLYVCYEHEESDVFVRLLSLEMGSSGLTNGEADKLRLQLREAALSGEPLATVFERNNIAGKAYDELRSYANRLLFVKGSGRHTTMEVIRDLVTSEAGEGGLVLFVDYLQKVATEERFPFEEEKITRVTEDLKELALEHHIPVVAVVAADRASLRSPRLRMYDLRGSSALAYESDVVLILNEKFNAVAKVHRAYDPIKAAEFRDWVVFSIEKNRSGPADLHLEFLKDFPHFRFDPVGRVVSESLVDDRLERE